MEDVMYDPPAYLWAITIAGPTAIAALTCIVLYGGAERAGLGRRRATLLAGAAAVLLGGWFTATAVIAGHGWYHTLPWFPVAAAGFLGLLLALSRIPVVARALTAPGMASRLERPRSFRVAGVVFLFYLALGHLPALFALPAGLGDIAAGIAAPLVARRLAHTPLMGPAAPATVTPLLGPADRGTMVSLMGPADPGTATPLMLPSR
jgi:hypothetical protein